MSRVPLWIAIVAGLVLVGSEITFAQPATGTPAFGSFGGGPFDTINLANLNVHFGIPVTSKSGRGIPFTYTLTYDSSVWYPVGVSGSQTWQPVANWGWRGQTEVVVGYVSYRTSQTKCFDTPPDWYWVTRYSNFVYHDNFGVAHGFNLPILSVCATDTEYATAVATDGSGYTIEAGPGSAVIHSRSGETINPPMQSSSGSGNAIDSNGNQISVSGSTFTDTLGTTALTVSGAAPNPVNFTYTNPLGNPVSVVLNYTTYSVKTNFGCSGISEYGPTSISLVSSVTLPDSTSYIITYEATPSGLPGQVTGRIQSITLPTGGTISYTYTGGSSGHITCADGSAAGLTRATPDGTWTYSRSGAAPAWTTTVTDPQSNQTVLNFQQIHETQRQIYQGSVAPANLLQTIVTCYNGNLINCDSTAITLPIIRRTITLQWPGTNGLHSKRDEFYNNGLRTEVDEYDYGAGSPGAPTRKTMTTYAVLGNFLSNRPATITVQDGSGNTKAQTTYGYDQTAVTPTSGTPQHLAVSGPRGNPTTISYLVQGSSTVSQIFTYYDTGMVRSATDVNGATTSYTYGACGNSFVTSISLPLNLSRSIAWNCTGGVMTSATDENNQTTTVTYNDPYYWRTNSVTDPSQNTVSITYNGVSSIESSLTFNSGSSISNLRDNLDALGRIHIVQQKQGPLSSNYDSVQTDFDSLGRPNRFTIPYVGTAGQSNPTGPAQTTVYDALGRPTLITAPNNSTVSLSYSQNDVLRTAAPAPTGENTKRRQFEYDGLGRLKSVCEISNAAGSGTCGQTSSATGYWTQNTFDTLNKLFGVTQNAQQMGQTQTRSYSYDGLGRLTQEINPEVGTTNYVYDTNATCGTSAGDLVKRTDAVGNTTCYGYDALHRVTSITYSGPYAGSTPNKYFVYDTATVNGVTMQNAKNSLAEAYTATCPTCTKITDIGLSYNGRGEVIAVYQSTPHSGGYYHLNASYWANGVLSQLSGLSGLPTINYGVDGEGRPNTVSASTGQNPVTGTTYDVRSQPTQVTFGSGDSDTFQFDSNTGLMTQYQFNVGGQSVTGVLTWNQNGTLGVLNITDPFNSADTQNCSYGYDDLARINNVNCGTAWAQTFGYDAFGNITKSGSISFQPTYTSSPPTNRILSLPGFTPSYDANGNLLNDSSHTYTWDAEGRPVAIDSVNLTYDALGGMVEQNGGGAYTQLVYDPTGNKLAIMSGQNLQKSFVQLPAGALAAYASSGLIYYRHPDWLGSSRLGSTPTQTLYSGTAYAPFGEPYAETGTTDRSFTGQNQDTVPGLYDFLFREYHPVQGRWISPDPAGLQAADLKDPQSLNRYAYVSGHPLTAIDPLGLRMCLSVSDSGTCLPSGTAVLGPVFGSSIGQWWFDPYFGGWNEPGGGGGWLGNFGFRNGDKGIVCTVIFFPGAPPRIHCSVTTYPNPGSWPGSLSVWLGSMLNDALLLGSFLTGTGQNNRSYGPNDLQTQDLAESKYFDEARARIAERCLKGIYRGTEFGRKTGKGIRYIPSDAVHSPTAAQMGAFDWSYTVTGGRVDFTVSNAASLNSLLYHIAPSYERSTFRLGGTIHQTFNWSEPSPCGP